MTNSKNKKESKKKDRRRSRSRSGSSLHKEIKKPIHQQIPMEIPFNPYLMYPKFILPRDPRLMFPMTNFSRMGFPHSITPMIPQVKPIETITIEQPTDKIVKDQNFLNSDEKLFESIINNEMSIKSIFENTQISEYLAGPYMYKIIKKIVYDPQNSLENLAKSLGSIINNNNNKDINKDSNSNGNYLNNNNILNNTNNILLGDCIKNNCSNNICDNINCGKNNNNNNCSLMHSIALNSNLGQDGLANLNANLNFLPKSNEILKHSIESFVYENTRKKCIDIGDMSSIRESLYKHRNRHLSDELNQML